MATKPSPEKSEKKQPMPKMTLDEFNFAVDIVNGEAPLFIQYFGSLGDVRIEEVTSVLVEHYPDVDRAPRIILKSS